ncbi:hypothetical protein [Thermogemmata fonticola]|uniref:Uncharacterized protein n=1 Tax=Thermogemmata fonticola TaxID=2755323 RepID=A0A7V8VG92_9BACT|nr:hypothetical protein [Thermogemmata fonticola]MBA2227381.1 hypothetical protein [Thermogemmata fonticola]
MSRQRRWKAPLALDALPEAVNGLTQVRISLLPLLPEVAFRAATEVEQLLFSHAANDRVRIEQLASLADGARTGTQLHLLAGLAQFPGGIETQAHLQLAVAAPHDHRTARSFQPLLPLDGDLLLQHFKLVKAVLMEFLEQHQPGGDGLPSEFLLRHRLGLLLEELLQLFAFADPQRLLARRHHEDVADIQARRRHPPHRKLGEAHHEKDMLGENRLQRRVGQDHRLNPRRLLAIAGQGLEQHLAGLFHSGGILRRRGLGIGNC